MKLKTYILLLAIFVLSPVALYFGYRAHRDYQVHKAWNKFIEPYKKQREIWAKQDALAQKLLDETEAMLKADHYGGKTPEETLDMFVDALKKRDYKLAAKYYLPWKRKEAEEDMKKMLHNEELTRNFLTAYAKRDFDVKINKVGTSIVFIYSDRAKLPYGISLQKNKVNDIWKIEKF